METSGHALLEDRSDEVSVTAGPECADDLPNTPSPETPYEEDDASQCPIETPSANALTAKLLIGVFALFSPVFTMYMLLVRKLVDVETDSNVSGGSIFLWTLGMVFPIIMNVYLAMMVRESVAREMLYYYLLRHRVILDFTDKKIHKTWILYILVSGVIVLLIGLWPNVTSMSILATNAISLVMVVNKVCLMESNLLSLNDFIKKDFEKKKTYLRTCVKAYESSMSIMAWSHVFKLRANAWNWGISTAERRANRKQMVLNVTDMAIDSRSPAKFRNQWASLLLRYRGFTDPVLNRYATLQALSSFIILIVPMAIEVYGIVKLGSIINNRLSQTDPQP